MRVPCRSRSSSASWLIRPRKLDRGHSGCVICFPGGWEAGGMCRKAYVGRCVPEGVCRKVCGGRRVAEGVCRECVNLLRIRILGGRRGTCSVAPWRRRYRRVPRPGGASLLGRPNDKRVPKSGTWPDPPCRTDQSAGEAIAVGGRACASSRGNGPRTAATRSPSALGTAAGSHRQSKVSGHDPFSPGARSVRRPVGVRKLDGRSWALMGAQQACGSGLVSAGAEGNTQRAGKRGGRRVRRCVA